MSDLNGCDFDRRELLKLLAGGALMLSACPQQLLSAAQTTTVPAALRDQAGVLPSPAMYYDKLPAKSVKCKLCPRGCEVADVERGYCGVRENRGGVYYTLVYGALCSMAIDPIEKKPLFHYLPGTNALSVATAGCNIECKFCQNWQISQFRPEQVPSRNVPPGVLASIAKKRNCPTIAYTYSEPVVFYEYMHDAAAAGREKGVGSVMITNGYICREPIRKLSKYLTGIKVDFKAFSEKFYQDFCAGELKPVLDAMVWIKQTGLHLELVVLLIPTLNDSQRELADMSKWIVKNLGPDVPVHFTRFHPTYRIRNLPRTPIQTLERARSTALDAGVHYAYAGNVSGHPGENTYCHSCGNMLIRRVGFSILDKKIGPDGKCPKCKTTIPGVWSQDRALAFKPKL